MALIDCQSCGKRVFTVRSRASVVRCPDCGESLLKEEEASETERRVREQLYGSGNSRGQLKPPRDKQRSSPRRRATTEAGGLVLAEQPE
jgi:predicted RNA-binding Zn-ribbon protein involved in translation (DUF1610 family)